MRRGIAVAGLALVIIAISVPVLTAATTITDSSPASAVPGTVVTISGSELNGVTAVTFNGIVDRPAIVSVGRNRDVAGYDVNIFGTNFTGTTDVSFNGTPVTWTLVSNNQISIHLPIGTTTGSVTVRTSSGVATKEGFVFGPGLLINPDFDTDVTGWSTSSRETPTNFSYHWNFFQDADQSPTSGSLDTTNIGTQATLGLFQCVQAAPLTRYSIGMRTLIPTGQAKVGKSELRIYWHSDTACAAAYTNPIEAVQTTTLGTWQTLAMNRMSPADTHSIEVYLGNWPSTVADNYRVFFDNVYLDVEHVPTVSTFTPTGPVTAGTWITINGIDFYGTTSVRFNGVASQAFEVKNERKIVAMAPGGAYTGPISVVTPGGTGVSSGQLSIITPPSITSFSPTSGRPGALIGIYGSYLDSATSVRFNTVEASFLIIMPLGLTPYIQATVPVGATSGTIEASNSAGGSLVYGFVVVTPGGDFDGNGQADILLRNYSTGANALWLMNGTAVSSVVDLPALPNTNYRIEGTADFNADGQPDIVLRNYATGQDAVWLMNGTTLSSIVDLPALPNTAYHFEGTGDFNSDGKPDLILRNYTTGQNAVWLMNGTAVATIVDLPALSNTAYKIESCGDFNGDGKPDIVLRNYTTGQNAVWLMDGTTLLSVVDLPLLANTAYRIDAIADFDADGKPDIVLRNYTTGQNAVWIMNGTSVSAVVDLPALSNTAYEINGPR